MAIATMNRKGYKRLNLNTLNFADDSQINKENVEATPIQWAKEVLSGDKQVIIKRECNFRKY